LIINELQELKRSTLNFRRLFAVTSTKLKEDNRISDLFMIIHNKNREEAVQIYSKAQSSLIKAKLFNVCNKYINPQADFNAQFESLQLTRTLIPQHQEILLQSFAKNSSELIALLVCNDRKAEANTIAEKVRLQPLNSECLQMIEAAMVGKFP
jgi:hypothetical protein